MKDEAGKRHKIEYLEGFITSCTNYNDFPEPNYNSFKGKTPVEVFEIFMTKEVIDLLVWDVIAVDVVTRGPNC